MSWFTFWGIVLLALSAFVGFVGLIMDSSVSTTEGTIHNLSKAHNQLIVLGIAAVGWLSGIMLLGVGALVPERTPEPLPPDNRNPCPYCRRPVDDGIGWCPSCGNRLAWLEGQPLTQEQLAQAAAGHRKAAPRSAPSPLR